MRPEVGLARFLTCQLSRIETGDHFSKNKQGTSSRRLVDLAARLQAPLPL
jgi:hypothetical protein